MTGSNYQSLVLNTLRYADKNLSLAEITEKVSRNSCPEPNDKDSKQLRRVLKDLIDKDRVIYHLSITGYVYGLKSRPVFPGPKFWFFAYHSYTKSINCPMVIELLISAYQRPELGKNEGIIPKPEEVRVVLQNEINIYYGSDSIESELADEELHVWSETMKTSEAQERIRRKVDNLDRLLVMKETMGHREAAYRLRELNKVHKNHQPGKNSRKEDQSTQEISPEEVQMMEEKTSFTADVTYHLNVRMRIPKGYPTPVYVPERCIFITESETRPQTHIEIQIPYCAPGRQPQFFTYTVPAPPRSDQGKPTMSICLNVSGHLGEDDNPQPKESPIKLVSYKKADINCLALIQKK